MMGEKDLECVEHRQRPRQKNHANVGAADIDLLAATGEQEPPDTTLAEAQRRALKELVRNVEAHHTCHELMFLACAFEDAARRKRAEEACEKKVRRAP